MGVFYAPETAMAKALREWEYGNPADGYRGYREQVITEFPKMLYRGGVTDDGVIAIIDSVKVGSPAEQQKAEAHGYFVSQDECLKRVAAQEREIAKLAAERDYHERWMSEGAKREIAEHEAATDRHLATIPEKPIKRRGRPRKVKEAPDGVPE